MINTLCKLYQPITHCHTLKISSLNTTVIKSDLTLWTLICCSTQTEISSYWMINSYKACICRFFLPIVLCRNGIFYTFAFTEWYNFYSL